MQDVVEIICPYCAEVNAIHIDFSGGNVQEYVEDCHVCCQPWYLRIELDSEEPVVTVTSQDD